MAQEPLSYFLLPYPSLVHRGGCPWPSPLPPSAAAPVSVTRPLCLLWLVPLCPSRPRSSSVVELPKSNHQASL